jgi:preprotein translocase subunit YajC
MIEALKPNDEVLTTAGIYGTVVRIDPEKERVVLRVADNVRLTFARSSIAQVLSTAEKDKEKAAETA